MTTRRNDPNEEPRVRKPYSAPSIERSGRLERLVLECTFTTGTGCGVFADPRTANLPST